MTIAKFINLTLLWLVFVAFVAQIAIDFSTINIASSCIIFTSVITTLFYLGRSNALETHPLSSFAIFGFCVTSQLGALLAQSASWVSVSENLRQPLITFALLAMYQAIALFSHILYRILTSTPNKQGLLRNAFRWLGVYATPSVINLWFMGIIGIFSLLLSYISPLANGLSFLVWVPFLIPIYAHKIGPTYCNKKRNYLFLVFFASLITLMAMAFNTRGLLFIGAVTILLLSLLFGMRSHKVVTAPMLLKFGMIVLLGAALSLPASNMVTAMVIARKDRFKVPLTEMVTNTIDNFLDPEKLSEYNKEISARELGTSYDETYIANPMVARFVITKFHDNAIYFAGKISDKGADEVWSISKDFFWAMLPQPWLDELKVDVDKDKQRFSMGDVLVNLAVGQPLGSYKTGSIFGQGWVMFGDFLPVIYFFMCLILYFTIDIFAIRTSTGVAVLSVIGMSNIWPYFIWGISADSFHQLLNTAVRGVVQQVILYTIVFAIAKGLSNLYLRLSHGRLTINYAHSVEN
jgi:hypothetical protein